MPRQPSDPSARWARLTQRAEQLLRTRPEPALSGPPAPIARAELAAMIDHTLLKPGATFAMVDHTLLKPGATFAMVDALCAEAVEHGFASVCVNSYNVARCAAAGAREMR